MHGIAYSILPQVFPLCHVRPERVWMRLRVVFGDKLSYSLSYIGWLGRLEGYRELSRHGGRSGG